MFLASPITFPNLGITVDPSPVAFTVFGKDIYWYGIIIASGFLLAVLYMLHRAKDFGVTRARHDPLGRAHRRRLRAAVLLHLLLGAV